MRVRFRSVLATAFFVFDALLFCSCRSTAEPGNEARPDSDAQAQEVVVAKAPRQIVIDGDLQEWSNAFFYDMHDTDSLPPPEMRKLRKAVVETPLEKGRTALMHDDRYLYVAGEYEDRDIVAYGKEDQMHHYLHGDTIELFLRSEKGHGYFEIYFTPNEKTSTFFFRGYYYPDGDAKENLFHGVRVAAKLDGTLNDQSDIDRGWTFEAAVPVSEIERFSGVPFRQEGRWTCLMVRYNYGCLLPRRQRSSFPLLPNSDYHNYWDYAAIKLLP